MNLYLHHIGDFNNATRHLTRVERSVYSDSIDLYYDTEHALPSDDFDALARKLMCRDEQEKQALRTVLAEFFVQTELGYSHARCDAEIAKYRANKPWYLLLTPSQKAAYTSMRNASRVSATPVWLSSADKDEIAAIYADAVAKTAQSGFKHEVDHIVPLRSKLVCGLHVKWNLAVITASENRAKSNKFEVL
jgi:uncharacterized protein YdaU (DUF1376 family)